VFTKIVVFALHSNLQTIYMDFLSFPSLPPGEHTINYSTPRFCYVSQKDFDLVVEIDKNKLSLFPVAFGTQPVSSFLFSVFSFVRFEYKNFLHLCYIFLNPFVYCVRSFCHCPKLCMLPMAPLLMLLKLMSVHPLLLVILQIKVMARRQARMLRSTCQHPLMSGLIKGCQAAKICMFLTSVHCHFCWCSYCISCSNSTIFVSLLFSSFSCVTNLSFFLSYFCRFPNILREYTTSTRVSFQRRWMLL
jgi:hypothetical protein